MNVVLNRRDPGGVGRGPGFTLVELLVIVAIIALLLAILMPTLNRARATARSAKCLTNVRNTGQAVNLYAMDSRGFLPPMTISQSFEGGAHVPPEYVTADEPLRVWHYAILGQYTGEPNTPTPWSTVDASSVWRCPEDGLAANGKTPSYSMAANIAHGGIGQFYPRINALTGNESPERWEQLPKLSESKYPSVVMTFAGMHVINGKIFWSVNGGWPSSQSMGNTRLYGNPDNSGLVDYVWAKNRPRKARNHRMWHPPFGEGGMSIGTSMGFIDGHAKTIVNTPSDVDGEYWLSDAYGEDFVFRPQDY